MSRVYIEHPDISAAARTGFAAFQTSENQDTPENRAHYIDEHTTELLNWLRRGYPDVLDEFIEFSNQACRESYQSWLN